MPRLNQYPPVQLSPEQFELEVKAILDGLGLGLSEYQSLHREVIGGPDGDYEIDVTVRFSALGANFLVLVECKHHKNPVKREVIQSLYAKLLSVGAQKGVVFSTSGFQSGALEFAKAHGIATVQVTEGRTSWFTKSIDGPSEPPPWANIEPIIGWLIDGTSHSIVSPQHLEYLRSVLTNDPAVL
ncbi:MAG: restriction endonuclease [Ramlibacter sp.]|nr:restriction endonuclease [Ramlibacter sp.]